jgi:hypothetical protein
MDNVKMDIDKMQDSKACEGVEGGIEFSKKNNVEYFKGKCH